jgi:hypothetical protein
MANITVSSTIHTFMQAEDKRSIQDHLDHLAGLTTSYHRQRQQSITEELLDIGGSFWSELGVLPGLDRPDSSAPR